MVKCDLSNLRIVLKDMDRHYSEKIKGHEMVVVGSRGVVRALDTAASAWAKDVVLRDPFIAGIETPTSVMPLMNFFLVASSSSSTTVAVQCITAETGEVVWSVKPVPLQGLVASDLISFARIEDSTEHFIVCGTACVLRMSVSDGSYTEVIIESANLILRREPVACCARDADGWTIVATFGQVFGVQKGKLQW